MKRRRATWNVDSNTKRRRRSSLFAWRNVYRMKTLSGAQMHSASERPRLPDGVYRLLVEGDDLFNPSPVSVMLGEQFDDDIDYWVDHCGYVPSEQACTKVGSEECDFDCPFAWNRRQAQSDIRDGDL